MMKVKVDRELCTGMAYCIGVAPDVFKLDDEGKAVVLDPSVVDDETLLEAAKSCPMDAIILEDDEGNQVYP
jgi:ferredoxin